MKTEKMQETAEQGRAGCLLIHGYGGSPFEMEPLEESLRAAEMHASTICLPGHGEGSADFASKRFNDWLTHAESEYRSLASMCDTVAVAGFSMGGTLALNIAARYPVSCVACIATPLYVLHFFPWPLAHMGFYARSAMAQLHRLFSGGKGPDKTGSRAIAPWKGHAGPVNIPQLLSFRAGCAATRNLLPRVTAPILIIHDKHDKIVYAGNAKEIAQRVSSPSITLHLTSITEHVTKHHMLTTHQETRDLVANEVTRFVRENASGGRGSAPGPSQG